MNAHTEISSAVQDAYRNQTFVYFDIETLPCQSPEYLDALRKNVKAPATYKKQESIDAWLAENREEAAKEALAKTSFDGGRGHICAIAWAINGRDIETTCISDVAQEAGLVQSFFDALDKYHSQTLVGHNIAGFDLRFLRQRAVALGIKMPGRSVLPRDPKPWDKSFFDTMNAWAGGNDRISMDNLCGVLGIKGKDGFDGSMVAEAWAGGEFARIAEYCADDVSKVRAIHQKFLQAGY